MKLDSGSLAFNTNIHNKVGGTPSWGTAIVYQNEDNKIKQDIAGEILIGMIYKKIDCTSHKLSIPLGKGGHKYYGDEDFSTNGAPSTPFLAAKFDKTYVNGIKVNTPFILLVVKDGYDAHKGRLQLKYSPQISWDTYENKVFFDEVYKVLGIDPQAPIYFYDINIVNQDCLHFKAVYKDSAYTFLNNEEYKTFVRAEILKDKDVNLNEHHISNNSIAPQIIYYGTPGTGKSHAVKEITGEIDKAGLEHTDLTNVFRTTFHPDSDYSTFVGGYKPTMKSTGQTRQIHGVSVDVEEITYEFIPQSFTNAYVYAYKNFIEDTYLVIEEINRGNCAQIFGDLFQLLDRKNGLSEYPIKADSDLCKYLQTELGADHDGIADGKLRLPGNLHIIGTMNTSDQSLFPMDSAFKRRWAWKYVPINYSDKVESYNYIITIGDKEYRWVDFLQKVNEQIKDLTSSEDKKMGNFFIKSNIGIDEFKDKVMFYVWEEVCKEEYRARSFFKRADGTEFSFSELYEADGTKILQEFIEGLGVTPLNKEAKTDEQGTDNEE